MKNTRCGFTLIELMIVCAIVGVLGAITVFGFTCAFSGGQRNSSEASARSWAKGLGLDVRGASCVARDSDGDGYVSCTVSTADGNIHSIECAGRFSANDGCRGAMPKINVP